MDTDYEIIKLNDGGIYHGEVNKNGLPQSSDGTCTWVGKNMSYSGGWIDGKMAGIGTLYENGKVKYRGFWWEGELIHIFGNEEQPKPEEKLPKNKTKMAAVLVGCDYVGTNQKALQCCPKEVDEIGRNLRQIGVDVSILKNKTRKSIEAALKDVCQKRHMYDHVLFYFSGHGAIYGGYHCLLDNEENLMSLESNVLGAFDDYDFKNIIIVHDACSSVISLNQETIDKLHDRGNMLTDNIRHTRNVLYAFSSLNGHPAWPAINHQYGMFALGFIENIHKKNLPVIQLFQNIADFVVSYSKQTHDCVIEVPHITKTFFDDTLCLYNPEE